MAEGPAAPLTMKMKLLVDTKAGRVVYAETGKDVLVFLFSLLKLPFGAVAQLLTAGAGAGSVVPPLDGPAAPTSAVAKLLPAANGRLFRCKGCPCSPRCYDYATRVSGTPCPVCKVEMTTEVQLVEPDGEAKPPAAAAAGEGSSAGYVRDMVTYIMMDDLSVAPMSAIYAAAALTVVGVTDITGLQAKTVEIGYQEGLALLKASLQSQTVLTDVFLGAKGSSGGAGAAGLGSWNPYRFRGNF
ncbi:hypothetical protein GQ55_5G482700 [Panicum hallii var. hallii]|uniref:DUF674 domain-containing protein n=1 Tax=Panicum hallii var. hallii TaxID=1504633 RepID=A0A2T7DR96_9POAL|nr:hypothetical protein GQ55_5G482700 [Panicum hallii var. hallii]